MNLVRGFCLLSLFCSFSCTFLDQNSSASNVAPYFDLSGYINNYIKDSSTQAITKTIQIEGTTETKEIPSYPLWKDVHAFDAYDINRPALYDKYSIDTVQTNPGSFSVIYQPKDSTSDLKVNLLQINYDQDQLQSIQIETSTKSFLEKVSLRINWTPSQGYTIDRITDKIFNSSIGHQKIDVRLTSGS